MPTKTSEISLDETNLFLFVGPADGGKSFAATSFGFKSKAFGGDDDRDCYMLEMDGRIAALRNRPIVFDRFTNVDGAIGVLKRTTEIRNTCAKFNRAPFHTLIFDSFSSFCDFALADSLDITIQSNLDPRNKDEKGRKRGDLQMATIEDYGYEYESVRQLLWENLVDIKRYANVIVIAHETENYKSIKTKPGEPSKSELDGYKILTHGNKIASRLPTKFDEIYHFPAKEVIESTRSVRRTVVFQDRLARSSYPQLTSSTNAYDITGVDNFYGWWKEKITA